MRKGNSLVVLSSDDDDGDDDDNESLSRSYFKPKRKHLVTRTNHTQPEKRRRFISESRKSKKFHESVNSFSYDDIDELFYGSKVSSTGNWKETCGSGHGCRNLKELWVDKYKPSSLEELAVHKKKVQEVMVWFKERLKASKENLGNNVLVISGQSGAGKSTTINLIASHFGATLCEWHTPTPTIWQEHMHNANTGISYISKLDEFVNFVEKVRKYGVLPSSVSTESKSPVILLIDDLPVTNGRLAFERLRNCLVLLARSAQVPTAILLTEFGKEDSANHTARHPDEILSSLESAGACKVAFNPITTNSIKKALTRICKEEQCNATSDQIDLIAKASGGDIRHAIASLQLFCVKLDIMPNLSSLPNSTPSYSDGSADDINTLIGGFSLLFGRDETLSLFHALGKFLHNKRETEVLRISSQDTFLVREKYSRLPLKMDAPEKVLCQAHGQARPIADFLHENVLDFISEDAMDAAGNVAAYLSDADMLLSSFHGILTRYNEVENVLQSAAASVAVRGVLFGNSHPSPSRWHAIRRPKLWQVEQLTSSKRRETVSRRFIVNSQASFCNVSDVATDYEPALKCLGHGAAGAEFHHVLEHHNGAYGESSESMSLDNKDDISDDDIEEW